MKNFLTICLLTFTASIFAQQDTLTVAVDTSDAVKMLNKIEVSKSGTTYSIKQFQDENTFVQTAVTGKKDAIQRLSQLLKQVNRDEALLVRQLVVLRERKKELKAARDLYR